MLTLVLAGCGGELAPFEETGPCGGGRFLLDFSESLFSKGTPHPPCAESLVIRGSSVSLEAGCAPVPAGVRTTEHGLTIEAEWERCGGAGGDDPACTFDHLRLRAASRLESIRPDCSILEGTITSSKPAVEKRFRACRVRTPHPSAPGCTAPVVDTSSGPLCGIARSVRIPGRWGPEEKTVHAYLGIRYATAGRWEDPEPFFSDRPARATQYGYACPQNVKNTPRENQSEDCLTLNIWTPRGGEHPPLPVMVFLHGGGFIANAASFPIYDGAYLAGTGPVVVVSLNYRLGALGFLGGGSGEGRLHGNFGFLDQIEALKWVQRNIGGFGGDPARVTLFGQSAGAMSTGLHLIAPASRDLFRAAIMQSNPYGIPYKRPWHAGVVREVFELEAGCRGKGLDCLKALPVWSECSCEDGKRAETTSVLQIQGEILMWVLPFVAGGLAEMLPWAPTVDGELIPGLPTDADMIGRIDKPFLAGTNRDEAAMFIGAIPEGTKITRIQYLAALEVLFGPAWVGRILENDRYRAGPEDNVPAMINVVTDYLWTCPNRLVMRGPGRAGPAGALPVYGYRFDHVPSYLVTTSPPSWLCQPATLFACHSHELPFVFHNPRTSGVPGKGRCVVVDHRFEDAERGLSDRMAKYWTHFATRLTPSHEGADPWPVFQPSQGPAARIVLGGTVQETRDLEANCDLWDSIGYDLAPRLPVFRDGPETERESLP